MKLIDKVRQTPSLLSHFSTPPVAVQEAAIRADPTVIKYIRNPNHVIQTLAVELGGLGAYRLINRPCYDAQKALARCMPMLAHRHMVIDETLMEICIRSSTDSVAVFANIPVRLQQLARSLSPRVEIISLIKNPHPDVVRDFLSDPKNKIQTLNYVPLENELEILDSCKTVESAISAMRNFRNPSRDAREYYVKMIIAMAKRTGEEIRTYAWEFALPHVNNDLKYEIFELIDFSKLRPYDIEAYKQRFRGCDVLVNALTLMS